MSAWQISMAISLAVQGVFVLGMSYGTRRRLRDMMWALSPRQRLFVRHGYLVALLPAAEAWVLWEGGFWS